MQFSEIQNQLTPGVLIETDLESGLNGLPGTGKKFLCLGNNLSTGTVDVPVSSETAEVYRITSEAQAIEYFGKGSNLAWMCRIALKIAPKSKIYASPYKRGVAAVSADADLTLATSATGSGTLKVVIMGEIFKVGFASGDTPTAVGDLIAAEINAHPNLPVTATNAVGVITLAHRNPGAMGNTARFYAEISKSVGMTVQSPSMSGPGTRTPSESVGATTTGTTDGDPSVQLTALEGERFHLIALDTEDSSALGELKDHMEDLGLPGYEKWGIGIAGFTGSAANCQTLANAQDSYRAQVAWLRNSEIGCYGNAAAFGAERSRYDARVSCIGHVLKGVPVPRDDSKWLSSGEIEVALEEGIVPIRSLRNGSVEIVRSVITRQTVPISFRDHCIQEKSDYMDETLIADFGPYVGATLKTESPPGQPATLTPDRAISLAVRSCKKLDELDYLQGTDAAVEADLFIAEANETDDDRIDLGVPFIPTRIAALIAVLKTYFTKVP